MGDAKSLGRKSPILKYTEIIYEEKGLRIRLAPMGEKNINNQPLLRACAYQKNRNSWHFIENASFCTSLTVFHGKDAIQSYIMSVHKRYSKMFSSQESNSKSGSGEMRFICKVEKPKNQEFTISKKPKTLPFLKRNAPSVDGEILLPLNKLIDFETERPTQQPNEFSRNE